MAGMLSGCGSERHSQVSRAAFRSTMDGKATDLYTLRNARGLEMTVTNFGGRVVELWVPDRDGNFADIVLGHDNLGAYVDQTGERFLGATIGRYGNRIAAGRFTLDGKEYTLPLNDGPNSLHGGAKGFDMVVWDVVEVTPQKIVLACLSPDGDQGYPGNLKVTMTYELTDDNSFVVTHEATTDRRTVVNLTHHSFFNLHGAGGPPINDHELMIAADFFTPVDSTLIPTGRLMPVEGTPMDFRRPAPIGSRLDADFEQLCHGHGYDHNWVLSRRSTHDLELAATVYEPAAGVIWRFGRPNRASSSTAVISSTAPWSARAANPTAAALRWRSKPSISPTAPTIPASPRRCSAPASATAMSVSTSSAPGRGYPYHRHPRVRLASPGVS